MADFQPFVPHGIIKLYRFVPLDESYQNTLHFKTRKQQLEYFDCLPTSSEITFPKADCKVSFSGQSFTRNERQYVRIEGNACNYYDCNYMAYQNEQFGEMWFFAFIHTVEYVNDYCTEITFEIDVMQSFMWNYELRECYVIREHSLTDKIGDSLTPEQIPSVPFINTSVKRTGWFDDYGVALVTCFSMDDIPSAPGNLKPVYTKVGNMPMGASIKTYDIDDYQGLTDDLQTIARDAGSLEGIVGIYVFPKRFLTNTEEIPSTSFFIDRPTDVDGYVPANNKLFTFPYTSLIVDCGSNSAMYKFELFYNDPCQFVVEPVMGAIPQIRIRPNGYNAGSAIGVDGNLPNDNTEYLVMENFPLILYTGNNAENWWGQNGWQTVMKEVVSALTIGAGIAITVAAPEISGSLALTGATTAAVQHAGVVAAIGGGASAIKTVGNAITNMNVPPTARSTGSAMSDFATKQRDFYFKIAQPTKEGAQIIDDLFTMYGYSTNKIKIPNIRNYDTCRPHFNYIQCLQMSFHWELFISEGKGTSVPQRYMSKILSIYQNGITFWKNPTEVGRYEQFKYQNSPQ